MTVELSNLKAGPTIRDTADFFAVRLSSDFSGDVLPAGMTSSEREEAGIFLKDEILLIKNPLIMKMYGFMKKRGRLNRSSGSKS